MDALNIQRYFLPASPLRSEDEARQESLTINFTLISLCFAIVYFIMSYFNGFLMARYVMVLVGALFLLQLFAYKFRWITLRLMTHFFVSLCWSVVYGLSLASNGIHSFVLAWVALIPIMALVLISSLAAWVWSAVGIISVISFLFIEPEQLLPPTLLMKENTLLTSSLHIGLLSLITSVAYLFERQQSQLLQKIALQNQELQHSKEEISVQNKALMQKQEELSSQSNTMAMQNRQLKEAREIIEVQHHILLQKNEGLEQEIQQRTRELVEYNQQLEQFAFISSHNLRAPIARILGLGNLLALNHTREDERVIQSELVQSARQLDSVVKDLNMILEVRKSNQRIVTELSVKQEIEHILISLQKEINETDAEIIVDVDEVSTVTTNKPYFDSIFTNLLSNAIKYRRPDAALRIHIGAEWRNGFAVFSIRDNGLGIDLQAAQNKLFSLYTRFHDHTEGKGLGLYMVKTQLDALGGKIEVDSKVGVGTVFKVYMKAALS